MIWDHLVCSLLSLGCALLLAAVPSAVGQDDAASERLVYVESKSMDDLQSVTSVALSPDGKFLYAAAYNANAVSVFARDDETGGLEHVQTIHDAKLLDAAVALRLSPDGKHAIVTSFRANSIALFTRDAESGKLELVDSSSDGDIPQAALLFAIDAAWSPDSKFVYVIAPSSQAMNVYRVSDDQLEFVERVDGAPLGGARGIAIDPEGRALYVTAEGFGGLSLLTRDLETGKVSKVELIQDGENGIETLAGAFSVTTSRDGQFVYVSSGRFQGDDAVTVFRRNDDGTLKHVQSLANGTDALNSYQGGNEIALSPDGRTAYAVASRSHTLSVFSRDPESGRLEQTQTISKDQDNVPLGTASGVAVSEDGRFVYIAAETDSSIAIFRIQSAEDE